MFTGIVEEVGTVRSLTPSPSGRRLVIEARVVVEDSRLGDSIAVNGCCLTLADRGDGWWGADVVLETLRCTNLGALEPGAHVNLERAVRMADRLGGHLVQGHVDGIGTVRALSRAADGGVTLELAASAALLRYVVRKGSVALDGVSLTVAEVTTEGFAVALIPHTLVATNLGERESGATINVEVDLVAKYLEQLAAPLLGAASGRAA